MLQLELQRKIVKGLKVIILYDDERKQNKIL